MLKVLGKYNLHSKDSILYKTNLVDVIVRVMDVVTVCRGADTSGRITSYVEDVGVVRIFFELMTMDSGSVGV